MNAASALRPIIKNASPDKWDELAALGFPRRILRRAAVGQPINASVHLRLCAELGLDPATGAITAPRTIGSLHKPSLSMALRAKRITDDLSVRQAAKSARMSHSALNRIEAGQDVSIDAILKACAWLERHPFEFVSTDVSRETSGGTARVAA